MLSLDLQCVELKIVDQVAWIVLNRPDALNAWTKQLGEELHTALDHAATDPLVRAIVFTGTGRAFSSGADLKSGGDPAENGTPDVLTRLAYGLQPAAAAGAHGTQAGDRGGERPRGRYRLLAGARLRPDRRSAVGLFPARLRQYRPRSRRWCVDDAAGPRRAYARVRDRLGERIGAEQARDWGLANRVVPDAELEPEAGRLAARLAAGPPGSYASIKRTLNEHTYAGFEDLLDLEAVLQQERAESADFMEGVSAFVQKRKPHFTGS